MTTGTLPDGRFPATLPAASGANLTALNATNLASGTIADVRLSNNVPLKDASNSFTGATQTISNATNPKLAVENGTVAARFIVSTAGVNVTVGAETNHPLEFETNSTSRLQISAAGNFDFKAGTVTTNNASASEPGFKGAPPNTQDVDYTLVLTDAGKMIRKTAGGAGETYTIPANASVAFPEGTLIKIVNIGGGDLTIAITTDTLYLAGVGTTGSRTLANYGSCVIEKVTSTSWLISGAGLS